MPLIFKGQLDHQRFRTWGAVAGAAVGVVGNALTSDSGGKNGGAGTQTQTKEPWLMAQPWIMNNMAQGQALQQQYQNQPFNAQQRQAYANQYAQSDYMRNLVPSLLKQMQSQPIGYDPANPNARASAWNWDALLGQGGGGAAGSMTAAQAAQDAIDAANRNRPAKEQAEFRQQDMGYTPQQQALIDSGRSPWLMGYTQAVQGGSGRGNGGYGSYTYGDTPQPGTQAYRDMQEYFLMGGNDPWDLSQNGLGIKRRAAPGGSNAGTNSGDGIGSSSTPGSDW